MNRIGVFLSGFVVASGVGYYNIHQDVWKTTSVLDKEIKSAKDIISKQNLELEIKQKQQEELIEKLTDTTEFHHKVLKQLYDEVANLQKMVKAFAEKDD